LEEKRRSNLRDWFTQLSYQELMDCKQKGLCFKCRGPFSPMHKHGSQNRDFNPIIVRFYDSVQP
jgi:hypothetical protein